MQAILEYFFATIDMLLNPQSFVFLNSQTFSGNCIIFKEKITKIRAGIVSPTLDLLNDPPPARLTTFNEINGMTLWDMASKMNAL